MLMLFVITLKEAITAPAEMDILEMEETALVTIHYALTFFIEITPHKKNTAKLLKNTVTQELNESCTQTKNWICYRELS